MVAIGMGIAWAGYAITLYGYCLSKEYDVTLGQLIYPTGQMAWPPPYVADRVNAASPQPIVAQPYLAPVTAIAQALTSAVSFLGNLVGAGGEALTPAAPAVSGAAGAVSGAIAGARPSATSPGTTSGGSWTVTNQSGQTIPSGSSGWTVSNYSGQ